VETMMEKPSTETVPDEVKMIDVSKYRPKNVPSLTWRECIKKIWKQDSLICPECQSEMKIISFITEIQIIRKILKYLGLWEESAARDPPQLPEKPDEIVYVPIEDAKWGTIENPGFSD